MDSFRAAGGILLLLTALDMLRPKHDIDSCRCTRTELGAATEREDISVVPVAIPMLAGPGAITSVMVFSTDHASNHLANFLIIVAALFVTFVISYFVLRSSVLVKRVLGRSGISVVQRIMGLLLAALSLQFISTGLVSVIKSLW